MKEKLQALRQELHKSRFNLRSWDFWRVTIVCFCFCCLLGHWLEIPYCAFMDWAFGIVEDDYDTLHDPWFYPYWVYGFGALGMTFCLEPFKEAIINHCKTLVGAFFITYVAMVILAAIMETGFGLLINQPDPITGEYPYWDNSRLPLNILGQGWLVNDLVIGAVAMVYLWLIFPGVHLVFDRIGPKRANKLFFLVVVFFAACVIATIIREILNGSFIIALSSLVGGV